MAPARRRKSGELDERAKRARSREGEPRESLEEALDRVSRASDASSELFDVPATVVCAFCGNVDCVGCTNDLSRSGIVSVVAWERPFVPPLARLWSTARSTTRDAEGFFELLPDGPIVPALRFAVACELLAAAATFLGFLAVAALVAPEWLRHLAFDPEARSLALRLVVLGLPAFASLLVVAHAAHGLSINFGARRNGGRSARTRALRFGLYACGWDLVMGPIGFVVVAVKEGVGAAFGLASALSGLPTRATLAFLRGCYRIDGEPARRALGTSYFGAAAATLASTFVILVALVALALL
jgi:hypothetical protein